VWWQQNGKENDVQNVRRHNQRWCFDATNNFNGALFRDRTLDRWSNAPNPLQRLCKVVSSGMIPKFVFDN
jgi:hypothetical protein